jgi:hypothetical protein
VANLGVKMKEPEHGAIHPFDRAVSRRRAVRLTAPPNLTVTLPNQNLVARVIDIGSGGVGLAASAALRPGTTQDLHLQVGPDRAHCRATVVHCRRHPNGSWLVGLAFVRDDRFEQVEALLDLLAGDLIEFR